MCNTQVALVKRSFGNLLAIILGICRSMTKRACSVCVGCVG